MDDLVQFLRARLDEDEAIARHATDGPWVDPLGGPIRGGREERFVIVQQVQRWNSQHIVRHDPARVLADIDADRLLLTQYEYLKDDVMPDDMTGVFALEKVLRAKAAVHDSHPDYREGWRP